MKKAFPPLAHPDARLLILGTMPGERSLAENQYYANNGNQFWKLVFEVFGTPFSKDYEERKALLQRHGIAVWDVLESCERKGSLDSNIMNEVPNDFEAFFSAHPHITHVFFSSKNAARYYERFVERKSNIEYHILPSPSGAYPMKFADKLERWKMLGTLNHR